MLAVAKLKELLNSGKCKAAQKALQQLKKDFPEIIAPNPRAVNAFDAFVEAEMLFCKGKFTKAVRSYNKFLDKYRQETTELAEVALDRQLSIATAYLSGRKRKILLFFKMRGYATGIRIMEDIIDREGLGTPIGLKAAKATADNYEKRKRFEDAYHWWSLVFPEWEMTDFGKEALLAMARCKHSAYRGPKYDVSTLIAAKNHYENFKQRYPSENTEVDNRLQQINEQLAYKQFSIGRYYQKTRTKEQDADKVNRANLYYEMVKAKWPQSTAAKMADHMIKEQAGLKELQGEKVKK
jgi:tetratricopeptide (TPR) repeat protein